MMVSWWVVGLAFILGGVCGIGLIALLGANNE